MYLVRAAALISSPSVVPLRHTPPQVFVFTVRLSSLSDLAFLPGYYPRHIHTLYPDTLFIQLTISQLILT